MTTAQTGDTTPASSLRLWPGIVLVLVQWLARFGVPLVVPEAMPFGAIAGLACALAIVVWWAFFSRAPGWDRLLALPLMIVAVLATRPLLHESIATAGMGFLFYFYAIPVVCLAFVVWAVACRRLPKPARLVTMAATLMLAAGAWTLFRSAGFTADGNSDFSWRWAQTPEERLVARADDEPPMRMAEFAPVPATTATTTTVTEPAPELPLEQDRPPEPPSSPPSPQPPVEWPGFRGPGRDGVSHATRINTDWSASPPVELWRRPIGPGWSSFAVRGDLLYTQEQRGDDEVVSAYSVTTGEPVWRHRDATRFWEANAGAGPRGTPALSGSTVYTLGATGLLNALEAASGAVVWSRNAASDTGAKLPGWGFSSSPLVVGDLVVVTASGALVAYDRTTGELRWRGPSGGEGYTSPQLATLDGVAQILHLSGAGLSGVLPADGTVLWEHSWEGYPIVQPATTEDGDLLIAVNANSGTRRLNVRRADRRAVNAELLGAGGWTVEERWTSNGLKPYFNDFVVHRGHAFGFDGSILASIDLADGERKWKGGRYGNGQLILLPAQDVLLVLSEKGDLALVGATTDHYRELARFPAVAGKTWNHPVLVGNVLLVRNGEEMVAFRLPTADL